MAFANSPKMQGRAFAHPSSISNLPNAPPQRTGNCRKCPARKLLARRRAAIHPLASHASLRKFQRSLLAAPERTLTSISTTFTPTAAGPTIWAMKSQTTPRALELLDWWEQELNAAMTVIPSHPVFIALRETILAKDIPKQPFADLLKPSARIKPSSAIRTWDAMIEYCVYSANPVGRLVLYLCGYRDEQRQELSDATCTALQLANFWQDVAAISKKDASISRSISCRRAWLSEHDIVDAPLRRSLCAPDAGFVRRTRAPLSPKACRSPKLVEGRLSVDLDMFSRGGQAILDAIEACGYDTLNHRPVVTKSKQLRLLRPSHSYQTRGAFQNQRKCAACRQQGRPASAGSRRNAPDLSTDVGAKLRGPQILRSLPRHSPRLAQQFLLRLLPASEIPNATRSPRCTPSSPGR